MEEENKELKELLRAAELRADLWQHAIEIAEKKITIDILKKGKGVTGKEAFNLLDGRSVHKDLVTKEGQPYKAWMKLDFDKKDKNNNFEVKQFHENYGFDLKAAVEKFPITDLKEVDKEKALMQSL